jgi:hypothetical protein
VAGALDAASVTGLVPAGGSVDITLPVIRAGGGLLERGGDYLGRLSAEGGKWMLYCLLNASTASVVRGP